MFNRSIVPRNLRNVYLWIWNNPRTAAFVSEIRPVSRNHIFRLPYQPQISRDYNEPMVWEEACVAMLNGFGVGTSLVDCAGLGSQKVRVWCSSSAVLLQTTHLSTHLVPFCCEPLRIIYYSAVFVASPCPPLVDSSNSAVLLRAPTFRTKCLT